MNYSAIQTAELFQVARETIRKWAIEFDAYLSATARPTPGGVRRFSLEDIEVFALVAEMKGQGKVYEDIHAALKSGQRGSIPEQSTSITTKATNNELALQQRLAELQTQLAVKDSRIEFLTEQNAALIQDIRKLEREIGQLIGGKGQG